MIDPPQLELTVHPFAMKFPPLTPEARAGLKADIQQNGLLHSIVVNQSNEILDGRHRYEICLELGLKPAVVQLADLLGGKVISEIEFIFSANFHRRHLTDDQRVAIYTEFLPELRKQAQENLAGTLIRGRLKGGAPIRNKACAKNTRLQKKGGVRAKLAEMANVGPGKAQRAIKLADNSPELLAQVKGLSAASDELVDGQLAQNSLNPPTLKRVNPDALQRKIDEWCAKVLDKFLAGFDPAQRPEVLRLVAGSCRARIEKLL
jgi:ParB-like chromosome segregation protein Spo0J